MLSRFRFVAVAVVAGLMLSSCAPPVSTAPPAGATGPSPGCGVTTRGPVNERSEKIKAAGAVRTYRLTVPKNHVAGTSDPIPLVLDFHGLLEGWVGTHPYSTQFSALAQKEGFAAVFPVGSQNGIHWNVNLTETNSDLRFIDALLEHLESTMCIDRSRVYITGLSYGASMTSMLMCMRANTFAAAAPVAGMMNPCTRTERAVPFVTFHGDADWILPFAFFKDTPGAVAAKYGCEPDPVVTTLSPNPDPVTRGPITKTTWNCDAVGSAAEFYIIGGGGHSWPGSKFFTQIEGIVGKTASSIDATEIIWDFFSQHRLPDAPA